MKSRSNFLFLVFNDRQVIGVLDFLSSAFGGKGSTTDHHLTIQGPFEDKLTANDVRVAKDRLKDDVIFIGNPDAFFSSDGAVLFLRVHSDNLRKVWNKPDYPIEKFGFNPHVTIYSGPDVERVRRALMFLKKNRLELICRDFDVVPYVSKQVELFPREVIPGDENAISYLGWKGSIDPSFRAKFLAAVNVDP